MTADRRLHSLLHDPRVETIHLSSTLRRALGISKKAAQRNPRLRPQRGLPGAIMIAIRAGSRDNVVVLAYDEVGESFAREFARRPDWTRLGL